MWNKIKSMCQECRNLIIDDLDRLFANLKTVLIYSIFNEHFITYDL